MFIPNLKTLYFNFKYFPFRQAVKFPVNLSSRVYLRKTSGTVTIEGPLTKGMILMGFPKVGIFDEKNSRSIWDVSGTVIFKGKAEIGLGSKICVVKNGTLIFGEEFTLTAESSIMVTHEVRFGDNCLVSFEVVVMDSDFHNIKDESGKVVNLPQPISISDHVWIGCRTTILKGSVIPANCMIGTNSLVNRKLKHENSVYSGCPVIQVRRNINWEL